MIVFFFNVRINLVACVQYFNVDACLQSLIFLVFFFSDRRSVFVNLRTHVPEKLIKLNSQTRTVEATNSVKNLKVYLYFSAPVLNSSSEILSVLHTSNGFLLPTNGKSLGNRRFSFLVSSLYVTTD